MFRSRARFRVVVAGRRSGKTQLALIEMLNAGLEAANRKIWYVAPNDHQAKRIAWVRLKALTEHFLAKKPNESELLIRLITGSVLVVKGAFNPTSLRGEGIDFLVLDEYADMRPNAWFEVFRPALADRKGRALFIGPPQGRNHFYDLFQHAKEDPDWDAFQFTTAQSGFVDQAELESAARNLDSETYRQEFEAEFTSVERNRAYYAFDPALNLQPVTFDAWHPLIWSIDFNVDPMCMLLMQEIQGISYVIDEIVIRPAANTEAACEKFRDRALFHNAQVSTPQRPLTVKIYGDASGNQHRTSSGSQTDWSIIKSFFNLWRGTFEPRYHLTTANPAVRDRVTCVNSRLQNRLHESHLLIHPQCKELIRDLEEVAWAVDSTGARIGELNKSDRNRTHSSDALGYFISQAFPLKTKTGEKGDGHLLSF